MEWSNEQIDAEMNTVKDIVTAIRRIRSINNFNKDQSESNTDKFLILFSNCINQFYFSVILISKQHEVLQKYEDIIQNLSGSTSLCFVENNSNLNLHSVTDIVEDHTEIHLLLKVFI